MPNIGPSIEDCLGGLNQDDYNVISHILNRLEQIKAISENWDNDSIQKCLALYDDQIGSCEDMIDIEYLEKLPMSFLLEIYRYGLRYFIEEPNCKSFEHLAQFEQ